MHLNYRLQLFAAMTMVSAAVSAAEPKSVEAAKEEVQSYQIEDCEHQRNKISAVLGEVYLETKKNGTQTLTMRAVSDHGGALNLQLSIVNITSEATEDDFKEFEGQNVCLHYDSSSG